MVIPPTFAPFKERLEWLNRDRLEFSETRVHVEETAREGKGVVSFDLTSPCLRLKVGEKPIAWLAEQRCADGLILELSNGRLRVHIIELKKIVRAVTWASIQEQFAGMLRNALAVIGVAGLPEMFEVVFYTAFTQDEVSATPDSLMETKFEVGEAPLAPNSWTATHIDICHVRGAHHKIPRHEVTGPQWNGHTALA
ncbi:MAG: hypothetical protein H7Y60_13185 [Rhodospirillaceae bacterium]|nr:hypothetical protein [Rhodospirillales bacterium]